MKDPDYLKTIRDAVNRLADPVVQLRRFVDRGQMYILDPELTGGRRILVLHPSMRWAVRRLGLRIILDDSKPRHERRRLNKMREIALHHQRKASR